MASFYSKTQSISRTFWISTWSTFGEFEGGTVDLPSFVEDLGTRKYLLEAMMRITRDGFISQNLAVVKLKFVAHLIKQKFHSLGWTYCKAKWNAQYNQLDTKLHCPPSGHFPGFVKCFLRVPQLLCSFPAAQASKGNSQKIVYKSCETT